TKPVFQQAWRSPRAKLFRYTTLFRSPGAAARPARGPAPAGRRCGRMTGTGDCRATVGVDIGGTKTRAAVVGPGGGVLASATAPRSEEHTSELQSRENLVCRLLLEKKK